MNDLQPIETAPKDDEVILYCGPADDPMWAVGYWHEPTDWDRSYFGHPDYPYPDCAKVWLEPGWRVWFGGMEVHCWPTHWAPVPQQPST